MDQTGDSSGVQAATETRETEALLGDDIVAAPSPPVFGNANANRTGSETNFRGINLDDIFSGVLFTPDGELLDIPSDDDENLNITLSTTRISEGRTQTSFGQFAVVGDTLASEESGSSGQFQDVLISPGTVKIEQVVDSESGSPSAGPLPESGHFQVPSSVGGGPVLAGGFTAEGATVVGTAQSNSKDSSVDRCSGVEDADASAAFALAADAAAAAAVAAAEARAAQDAAVAKAEVAAKAAEAHAQAQARVQAGGTGTAENSPQFRSPGSVASNSFAALPTGGIIGHGTRTNLSQGIGIGRGGSGGVGIRGITSVAPPSGYRGRGSYMGSLPRRQRHKVSSRDLTEEQRNERRERNREHAKRSRVRKKFLLDSLQRSVDALQAENESLKGSIIGSLGQRGRELVAKCSPEDAESTLVTANPTQATKILDDPDYSLVKALQTAQQNFVITDASLPDNPIVFASNGFLELTRYKLNEVLGRNCRFLQGPETDPRAVDKIRTAIDEGYDTNVCLLNYRADGTTFWNQFFVAALRDGEGNTVNYVGVQCKVGDDYARIVVNAQKKQLARFGSTAGSTRRGPHSQREQQVLRPSTSSTEEILTVDAYSGASAAFAAESKQGQGGADI